jgi:hypothetical protein
MDGHMIKWLNPPEKKIANVNTNFHYIGYSYVPYKIIDSICAHTK